MTITCDSKLELPEYREVSHFRTPVGRISVRGSCGVGERGRSVREHGEEGFLVDNRYSEFFSFLKLGRPHVVTGKYKVGLL